MPKLSKLNQRIADVFDKEQVPSVSEKTLAIYLNYLKQHLELPCQLTGVEDFPWEEFYILGPGSKTEHKQLRKEKPSYLDTYTLMRFEKKTNMSRDLLVKVKRVSDNKQFVLPSSDLKSTDKQSNNYQLLYVFSVWIVNYQ